MHSSGNSSRDQEEQNNLFTDASSITDTPKKISQKFKQIVAVMVPRAISAPSGCYDYGVPSGMVLERGDFVAIPLGRQILCGVVWGVPRDWTQDELPQKKLRAIVELFEMPRLGSQMSELVDWVAHYTMSAPGQVLRMILPAIGTFAPDKMVTGFLLPEPAPARMTAARQKIHNVLMDMEPAPTQTQIQALSAAELAKRAGVSTAVIRKFCDAGGLEEIMLAPVDIFQNPEPDFKKLDFSNDQQAIITKLIGYLRAKSFSPCLLDGVTGSGKTEVYFEAIAEALRQNKQSMIILPEIALTAQFLTRFEERFGVKPALWHSGLTPAQRRRTWRAVAQGRVKVVVGARSVMFLPWQNLGLLVVDEEHDAGFKQEEGVIYNARDMAVVCASLFAATIILSSATPSLETVINAQDGRYARLVLTSRHGRMQLPNIHLVDMRLTPPARGHWLSPVMIGAVQTCLEKGEQALLFLNRRGYAPLILCRSCGHRYACADCDSWLVEHRRRRVLACHQCGYERAVPQACDACEETEHLTACGPGVERIMEEVGGLFPDKRVTVLSSDLMSDATVLRATLERITEGGTDIIVGTQMIAKGHHFPKLGFVGVVDADLGMGTSDLRAGERTFQMLSQVTGRAGRELTQGQAMLQSYVPDHPVLQALAQGHRDFFLQREAEMRQLAKMPPFGRLAGIVLSGAELQRLTRFARQLAHKVPLHDTIRVLGPAPAPIAKIRGMHRLRFLVHGQNKNGLQGFIHQWLSQLAKPSAIRCIVDIDPYSFF